MYTYYIKAKNIDENIFKERGNWKRYRNGDKLNFLFIEQSQFAPEKRFYNMEIDIENKLIYEGKDKYNLINSFLNSKVRGEKNLVMDQILIDINKQSYQTFIKDNKVYILKPVKGYAKKGIEIIENKKDFRVLYTEIRKKKDYDLWVVQEYITNPLLYLGKKFHFRCYYILTQDNKAYLYHNFTILRAKNKYKKGDYKNQDIHISRYIPEDEKIRKKLLINDENKGAFTAEEYSLIKKGLLKVHRKIKDKIDYKCYPNAKNCFQIFGSDVIFTDDYKPKLIELNASPSFDNKKLLFGSNQKPVLEGIMQEIVDKKFPPKNKIKRNNHLIKL